MLLLVCCLAELVHAAKKMAIHLGLELSYYIPTYSHCLNGELSPPPRLHSVSCQDAAHELNRLHPPTQEKCVKHHQQIFVL